MPAELADALDLFQHLHVKSFAGILQNFVRVFFSLRIRKEQRQTLSITAEMKFHSEVLLELTVPEAAHASARSCSQLPPLNWHQTTTD